MTEATSTHAADQVAALIPQWRSWLRVRHRSIEHLHADLAQQAATDLLEWVQRAGRAGLVEEDLRRVGFRILQRRVADAFRSSVAEWGGEGGRADDERTVNEADPRADANPALAHHYGRLLRAVVALLAELRAEDRALLLGVEVGAAEGPRTPAQRQKLKRLREALRNRLQERFGLEVDLLPNGGE